MHETNLEQEVINLSKEKWRWMSEHKVDILDTLFHEMAVFVHMGGNMTKEHELDGHPIEQNYFVSRGWRQGGYQPLHSYRSVCAARW